MNNLGAGASLGCSSKSRKAAELADEFAKTNGIKLSAGERNGLEAAIIKDAEKFFRTELNGFARKSYSAYFGERDHRFRFNVISESGRKVISHFGGW